MPNQRVTPNQMLAGALGPQLFSSWTLLMAVLLSYFARITPIPGDPQLTLAENMWLNLVSGLAAYLFLLWVTYPLVRLRPQWHLLQAVSVFVAGSVRGFALQQSMDLIGEHSTNSLEFRLVSSGTLYGITLLVCSYALGSLRSRISILRQLRAASHTLEQEVLHNKQSIDGWYQSLALNLKARLRREVDRHLGSADATIAAGLKDQVAEVVRPLSQELIDQTPQWSPPPAPPERGLALQLLSATLDLEWRVYPLLTSTLGILSSSAVFLQFIHVHQYFLAAVATVGSWLGYVLGNFIYRRIQLGKRWPVRAAQFVVIFTLFNLPASLIATGELAMGANDTVVWGGALLLSVSLSVAGLLLSIAGAMQRALELDQARLEELNADLKWIAARTSTLMWERQRDLSRILHGPVQSALAAAAIRLDFAQGKPQDIPKIVEESRASIIAAINEITDGERQHLNIMEAFSRVIEGWEGITQVVVGIPAELDDRINSDPSCARILFDIVQEAVANSARHGEAKNVVVTLGLQGDSIVRLEIRDDGHGLEGQGESGGAGTAAPKTGLGSRLLDDCTLEWSRVDLNPGVELTCLVPILPDTAALQI